jgi:hypothetical protein
MRLVQLGRNGPGVPEKGLGCMGISGGNGHADDVSDRPCFQGGQCHPGDFGRERREFAGGLRRIGRLLRLLD